MARLSYEDHDIRRTICTLLYLSGSFLTGLHILMRYLAAHGKPEWLEEPLYMHFGEFLLVMAVALHIFFAWKYRGEFESRAVLAEAVLWAVVIGALLGVPLLLAHTALAPDARKWLYLSMIKAMVGNPPLLTLAGAALLVIYGFRTRPVYLLLSELPAPVRQEPTAQPENDGDVG